MTDNFFPLVLLVRDSGEIMLFNSVYELQAHVERIDIDNDEYQAWDMLGRQLRLRAIRPIWIDVEILRESSSLDVGETIMRSAECKVGVQVDKKTLSNAITKLEQTRRSRGR